MFPFIASLTSFLVLHLFAVSFRALTFTPRDIRIDKKKYHVFHYLYNARNEGIISTQKYVLKLWEVTSYCVISLQSFLKQ